MKAMIFVSSGYGEFSSRAVEPIFHSLFVMGINKKGETSDRCTPWRVAAAESSYILGSCTVCVGSLFGGAHTKRIVIYRITMHCANCRP